MPTDTRRLTGPDVSHCPYNFCPQSDSPTIDVKSVEFARPDGRQTGQLRPLFLRSDVVSQARGSGYIEMNKTKVMCAVYGPREVTRKEDFSLKGQLTCDFKFCSFSCRYRRQHQQDIQERDLSVQIVGALEPAICLHKYPKSQINMYITVLENDGCALSAAIICASIALASAGVEMYDLVVASSAAMYREAVLTDPCSQEEESILNTKEKYETNAGTVTVALLPSLNQVSAITSDGQLTLDTLTQAMHTCRENCEKVYSVLRHTLLGHLVRKGEEKIF